MDIDGVRIFAYFEVIEIVDDIFPYLALLGIDWAFDIDVVISLKKRKTTFERKALSVIVPLDPTEGACYTEPVHDFVVDDGDLY